MNEPEHKFTEGQIAMLLQLLGSVNLSPLLREDYLFGAARHFTSDLVFQNYPPHSRIDKSLEQIESAASRLRVRLSDAFAMPYVRMAAGDVLKDDRTLDTAIDAVENLRRWTREAREIVRRNKERARRDDAEHKAIALPGKPWRTPKKSAMRVLVHRLALLWLHTHRGTPPTGSVNSAFVKFAQSYLTAMRARTTGEHRRVAPSIDKELKVSDDAIGEHLKAFRAKLKPTA